MDKRYIYNETKKKSPKSMGYGDIEDTKPKVSYDNKITTVYGKDKAMLVLDALNLKNDLSKLRKGATKKEIAAVLNEYKIGI
jgi:hypothetical protein